MPRVPDSEIGRVVNGPQDLTPQERMESKARQMFVNPKCEQQECGEADGEVRWFRAGGDNRMLLCRTCFDQWQQTILDENADRIDNGCQQDVVTVPSWSDGEPDTDEE